MKTLPILLCVFAVSALGACSGKPPEPQAQPQAQSAATVTTPFDALIADKQRARNVQKVIDKHAKQQRKALEAAQQ